MYAAEGNQLFIPEIRQEPENGARVFLALGKYGAIGFRALLAMQQKCVTAFEGIIDEDVDQCIRNLTRIGSQGMNETDRLVLDIMTHKTGRC